MRKEIYFLVISDIVYILLTTAVSILWILGLDKEKYKMDDNKDQFNEYKFLGIPCFLISLLSFGLLFYRQCNKYQHKSLYLIIKFIFLLINFWIFSVTMKIQFLRINSKEFDILFSIVIVSGASLLEIFISVLGEILARHSISSALDIKETLIRHNSLFSKGDNINMD